MYSQCTPWVNDPSPPVIGGGGCDSGELDTWGHEYGPSPSNYDQEQGLASVVYCLRLASSPGFDVGEDCHS